MNRIAQCLAVVCSAGVASAQTTTFNYTGAIQTWIVPTSGLYTIVATGANGGSSTFGPSIGGRGAVASGDLYFAAGTSLSILVGSRGVNASFFGSGAGGGGGGSFVVLTGSTTPMVVAGGGGGIRTGSAAGADGLAGPAGGAGSGGELGGVGGLGGSVSANGSGAGGGGFGGDGLAPTPTLGSAIAGRAFVNGGLGGFGSFGTGGAGGFGGGGGGGSLAAGGGGGYSGGASGFVAGGGGSYVFPTALNASVIAGGNAIVGHNGQVTITLVPTPSGAAMMGVGGLIAARRSRRVPRG